MAIKQTTNSDLCRLKYSWKFKTKVYTAALQVIPFLVYRSSIYCCSEKGYKSHPHIGGCCKCLSQFHEDNPVASEWHPRHSLEPLYYAVRSSQPVVSTGITWGDHSADTWPPPGILTQKVYVGGSYAIFEEPT